MVGIRKNSNNVLSPQTNSVPIRDVIEFVIILKMYVIVVKPVS